MVRSTSTSKAERSGAAGIGNAATAADERRQRKKLQNRLNQRAHRSRTVQKKPTSNKTEQRQYQIDRWRLDEYQTVPSAQASPDPGDKPNTVDTLDPGSETTWFPLSADHLIHLIKYNVFRGLLENKALLETLAINYHMADNQMEAFSAYKKFPSYSVIMPVAPHGFGCLTPTPTQMKILHSTWINFLPFPTMRENLISWESAFDHADLVRDLVGDLINMRAFLSASPSSSMLAPVSKQTIAEEDDEEPTTTETGLIVWGEPHRADSWEATPQFLRKWAWAAADCQELIDSTNRWREMRGEKPLRFSVEATTS